MHFYAQDLSRPVAAITTDLRGDRASLQRFLPPGDAVGPMFAVDVYLPHSTKPTQDHWTERPTS